MNTNPKTNRNGFGQPGRGSKQASGGARRFNTPSASKTPAHGDSRLIHSNSTKTLKESYSKVRNLNELKRNIKKVASEKEYVFFKIQMSSLKCRLDRDGLGHYLKPDHKSTVDAIPHPILPLTPEETEPTFNLWHPQAQDLYTQQYEAKLDTYTKRLERRESLKKKETDEISKVVQAILTYFESHYAERFKSAIDGTGLFNTHQFNALIEAMEEDYRKESTMQTVELRNLISNEIRADWPDTGLMVIAEYLTFWVEKVDEMSGGEPTSEKDKAKYMEAILARSPGLTELTTFWRNQLPSSKDRSLYEIVALNRENETSLIRDAAQRKDKQEAEKTALKALELKAATAKRASNAAAAEKANTLTIKKEEKKKGKDGKNAPRGSNDAHQKSSKGDSKPKDDNRYLWNNAWSANPAQHQQNNAQHQQYQHQHMPQQYDNSQFQQYLHHQMHQQNNALHQQFQHHQQFQPQYQVPMYPNTQYNQQQSQQRQISNDNDNLSIGSQNSIHSNSMNMFRHQEGTAPDDSVPENFEIIHRVYRRLGEAGISFFPTEVKSAYYSHRRGLSSHPTVDSESHEATAVPPALPNPPSASQSVILETLEAMRNETASSFKALDIQVSSILKQTRENTKDIKDLQHESRTLSDTSTNIISKLVSSNEAIKNLVSNQDYLQNALGQLSSTLQEQHKHLSTSSEVAQMRLDSNETNISSQNNKIQLLSDCITSMERSIRSIQVPGNSDTSTLLLSTNEFDSQSLLVDSGNSTPRNNLDQSSGRVQIHPQDMEDFLISLDTDPLARLNPPIVNLLDPSLSLTENPLNISTSTEINEETAYTIQHVHALSTPKNDSILDSGASCGISSKAPMQAFDVKRCNGAAVAFGGESKFSLKGTHTYKTPISNYNLLIKETKIDIVSVSQADQLGLATLFFGNNAVVWSPVTNLVHETASLKQGLYHIDKEPRLKYLLLDLSHFPSHL